MSFFPLKLFFAQIKTNLFLLIYWPIIIAFITGDLAKLYGLQYLFIAPEYFNQVNFWAFFIVGIFFGLFTMSFHVTSYVYLSKNFPFLATLEKPFLKFSINNSLPPTITLIVFFYNSFIFMFYQEMMPLKEILLLFLSFSIGVVLTISLMFTYFFSTNKNVLDLFGDRIGTTIKKTIDKPLKVLLKKEKSTKKISSSNQKTKYYLRTPFIINRVRPSKHYDKQVLLDVLQQHHYNGGLLMMSIILLMFILGIFSDLTFLKIPAAATILLIFSLYLMLIGVIHTWFKKWTFLATFILLIVLNYYSPYFLSSRQSQAYGLDYSSSADYNILTFNKISNDSIFRHDYILGLETLKKWKSKNAKLSNAKPKLVLINSSGGGLRSSLWTFNILNQLDSVCDFNIMKHTHLITGASGGMLGATYYRQLYLYRSQNSLSRNFYTYYDRLGKDVLNPVMFTYVVNDLFFPFKRFTYNKLSYTRDRGTELENQINKNTDYSLETPVKKLAKPEINSEIPMMIFSPTIINDGRKLLISPCPISYLTYNRSVNYQNRNINDYDAVEFSRLFKNQGAENLRLLSALRISATFPFISPMVELPTNPKISLIDAGVRDNLGFEITLRFMNRYQEWIKNNTSGVVIIKIKADRATTIEIGSQKHTLSNTILDPIFGVVKSFSTIQIYNHNQLKEYGLSQLDFDLDIVTFNLFEDTEEVSLSWHLTSDEKRQIINAKSSVANKKAFIKFRKLLQLSSDNSSVIED
ncbi:MAG: patatin-like phospholipase family protein [Flavobacteriales bacterium]|nr:patatin-like phospholipase family protein [Flavobacteriales bacterium]